MALDASESLDNFKDPIWRLSNLYYIVDKHGQRVLFKPNEAQKDFLQTCSKRDLILKARQLGFTTLMSLVGLDECLWNNDWNAAIIAHKLDDAKAIFATKVKYPYDNLPQYLRDRKSLVKSSADSLEFSNGSKLVVTSSARSGTFQRLHISEFGKICAQYPHKAKEVVTGSLPAAEHGAVTIESTAEGQDGKFFEYVQTARTRTARRGAKDWAFHFYPWYLDSKNTIPADHETITAEQRQYFEDLEYKEGIKLTDGQKAWWVATERDLGGDMKRENPATPEEAFEQAIEGAYFATQLAHTDKNGFIGRFPHDPRYPVNSFWDLGRNDFNTIWLHQRIGERNSFIRYYENSGEHISHYARWLRDYQRETGCEWGEHYWPHDGDRNDLFLINGRLGEAEKYEIGGGRMLRPSIVGRPKNKMDAIEASRAVFPTCDFDEADCAQGIKRLRHYRKEYDEMREVWKDRPRHDDNSHGADGFMTFACGFVPPAPKRARRQRGNVWAA